MGPSPDEESAFLAEQSSLAPGSTLPAGTGPSLPDTAPEVGAPLPALDGLVQRIPAEAREVMEELFRAKFVTVKRVPRSALKP
ncbi:MAG: hypothetical protein ACHQ5A_02580 [Opitutales bacterium]